MIIAKSRGQLGNQIFQYGALKKISKRRELLFLVGFADFREAFSPQRRDAFVFSYRKKSIRVVQKFWTWLEKLVDLGVLGEIVESQSGEIHVKTGVFGINLSRAGFFQNPDLMDFFSVESLADKKSPRFIKPDSTKTETKPLVCFVHIRRGDYLTWPSAEKPAAIPITWFLQEMRKMHVNNPRITFKVFSDGLSDFEITMLRQGGFSFVIESLGGDFFSMSSADAGILSPSSFSWWAGHLASRNGKIGRAHV